MRKTASKGIIRNKFELLLMVKDNIKRKQSRFSKNSLLKTSTSLSSITDATKQNTLLEKSGVSIQLGTIAKLPPQWVFKFQDCQTLLEQVSSIKIQIKALQLKRISVLNEKEEKHIDRAIYDKTALAASKISECDKLLKQIKQSSKGDLTNQKMCANLCTSLALSIQQKTREIKNQQRYYLERRKQLEKSTKITFLDLAVGQIMQGDIYADKPLMNLEEAQMQQRNKEIQKLSEAIIDLNQIYRQMSELVLVQGTLLDRIDINLDAVIQKVEKGNQNLKEALLKQESPFASRCIKIMIVMVALLGLVMILKYSR